MIELRRPVSDSADSQAAYDALYSDVAVSQHWDSFFAWVLDHLRPRSGASLLDVSCGTGMLLQPAREAGLQAVGVDFSRVAIRTAQSYGPAFVGNGEHLPLPDASFDYVVNLGSLEHFEDMASGVREMARVLKPTGTCCILVPNTFGLLWTIWHAKNTGDIFADDQPLQRYGTRMEWQRLFQANGLVVKKTIAYELPPPRHLEQWAFYLRHPKIHLTKLLLWRLVPLNLASVFMFMCERATP